MAFGTVIDCCRISSCTLSGISASNNVVIQNCVSGGNGFHGFAPGTASTVVSCEAGTNGGAGITIVGGKGSVSYCSAPLKGGTGIDGGIGGNVSHCFADHNTIGILVGNGGVVSNCTASDNRAEGISAGTTSSVVFSSALDNDLDGIRVSNGSVTGCTARQNGDDGIDRIDARGVWAR